MSAEDYMKLEAEFMSRTDALCENMSPFDCDCSQCPCKDLCNLLSVTNITEEGMGDKG